MKNQTVSEFAQCGTMSCSSEGQASPCLARHGQTQAECGFSLAELMTALALIAAVSLAAAPSMTAYLNQQQTRTAEVLLESAMRYARSEGKIRSIGIMPSVFLCPRAPGADVCIAPNALQTNSLSNGWLIYAGSKDPATSAVSFGSVLKSYPLAGTTQITTSGINTRTNVAGPFSLQRLEYSAYKMQAIDTAGDIYTQTRATVALDSTTPAEKTTDILLTATGQAGVSSSNNDGGTSGTTSDDQQGTNSIDP